MAAEPMLPTEVRFVNHFSFVRAILRAAISSFNFS
jgi:hypothetical protein